MARLSKEEFAARYKHPKWQFKRLEIMNRDKKCLVCGAADKTLNVHHEYYVSGRQIWDYPNWSLSTLCEDCHKERHGREIEGDEESQISEWESVVEFVSAGQSDAMGGFWFTACEIGMAIEAGIKPGTLFIHLEKCIKRFVSKNVQQTVHQNP